jgi:hypothetical protein
MLIESKASVIIVGHLSQSLLEASEYLPKTQQTMISKLLVRSFEIAPLRVLTFEWVKRVLSVADIELKIALLATVQHKTDPQRNGASNPYYTRWIATFDEPSLAFLKILKKT